MSLRSGRRATNNRIRGPQSALTDFLASNNISAAQIRDDYERRRQVAQQDAEQDATGNEALAAADEEQEEGPQETSEQTRKRKRQEEKAIAKIKQSKTFKRQKASQKGEPDGDEDDIAWDMYAKSKPLPGQLENCEICDKRFTVTAYSKTGPDGGLLCSKCSKEQEAEKKKEKKPKPTVSRDKRRHLQSTLLDGIVRNGSKSLQELCVEKVADNINDIEEFGDLPETLLNRLSQILSRRRAITARTLDLFLRPDLNAIAIYDCAKLETDDYIKLFSIVPRLRDLNLRNSGQFKDEVIDYILERDITIQRLQLAAPNLVSDAKWREFFRRRGTHLESLKLSGLDYAMDDNTIMQMTENCPNVRRLKLKECFKLADPSLEAISRMKKLEHLSLRLKLPTSASSLGSLITQIGHSLRTLSLERFENADDSVLETIHTTCTQLGKLRFTLNDFCTDAGFVSLFSGWPNPPLAFADFSSNRDLDYANPDGPTQPVGLASDGFRALLRHSGSRLECLDISSCRHITYEAFSETFDGVKQYPYLQDMNISFLTRIDTPILAGIFRSCPQLTKVTAFGCFNIRDVEIPAGLALIGVPNAQDSIVRGGD